MDADNHSHHSKTNYGLNKARIEALSDGIFAIVMTLLVFDLKVPELDGERLDDKLYFKLMELLPMAIRVAVSFLLLGLYWVGHHAMYHHFRRTDRYLVWLNLFFLLGLTFIPFSTQLLGKYHERPMAEIVYGGNLTFVGLFLYSQWWYGTRNCCLVDHNLPDKVRRRVKQRILMGPVMYLIAIALSWVSPALSLAMYIFVPILYFLPSRVEKAIHTTGIPVEEPAPIESN